MQINNQRFASFSHAVLLGTERYRRFHTFDRFWRAAWNLTDRKCKGPITTRIHGQNATINFGYTYPINARKYPLLNNPLLEIAHQTYLNRGRALTAVDIGAAVGDTVLFLRSNCGDEIGNYICIDGDPEFAKYLQLNLSRFPEVTIITTMLSETSKSPELVRTHSGTASPQGSRTVASQTLDEALATLGKEIDLIKIDVDGFDGRVIAGAGGTLATHRPSVIFEWHPILYKATGSNTEQPFRDLAAFGYDRSIWFTKYGEFSHFKPMADIDLRSLEQLCLRGQFHHDWHYDVVVLPKESTIDEVQVAECSFARQCRSRY